MTKPEAAALGAIRIFPKDTFIFKWNGFYKYKK